MSPKLQGCSGPPEQNRGASRALRLAGGLGREPRSFSTGTGTEEGEDLAVTAARPARSWLGTRGLDFLLPGTSDEGAG